MLVSIGPAFDPISRSACCRRWTGRVRDRAGAPRGNAWARDDRMEDENGQREGEKGRGPRARVRRDPVAAAASAGVGRRRSPLGDKPPPGVKTPIQVNLEPVPAGPRRQARDRRRPPPRGSVPLRRTAAPAQQGQSGLRRAAGGPGGQRGLWRIPGSPPRTFTRRRRTSYSWAMRASRQGQGRAAPGAQRLHHHPRLRPLGDPRYQSHAGAGRAPSREKQLVFRLNRDFTQLRFLHGERGLGRHDNSAVTESPVRREGALSARAERGPGRSPRPACNARACPGSARRFGCGGRTVAGAPAHVVTEHEVAGLQQGAGVPRGRGLRARAQVRPLRLPCGRRRRCP